MDESNMARKTQGVPAPKVLEIDVQEATVKAIRFAGFEVYETSAWRQKGPSGVDRGVPDLLVVVPRGGSIQEKLPLFIGIEMKKPGKIRYSSPEQERAHSLGHIVVAQSVEEALEHLRHTLAHMKAAPYHIVRLENMLRGMGVKVA